MATVFRKLRGRAAERRLCVKSEKRGLRQLRITLRLMQRAVRRNFVIHGDGGDDVT